MGAIARKGSCWQLRQLPQHSSVSGHNVAARREPLAKSASLSSWAIGCARDVPCSLLFSFPLLFSLLSDTACLPYVLKSHAKRMKRDRDREREGDGCEGKDQARDSERMLNKSVSSNHLFHFIHPHCLLFENSLALSLSQSLDRGQLLKPFMLITRNKQD